MAGLPRGGGVRDRRSEGDLLGRGLGAVAGGWLGSRPMGVSEGHMGSRVSAFPGQALAGTGPDVVRRPQVRTSSVGLFQSRDVCGHSRLRGWETGSRSSGCLPLTSTQQRPGESFSGLAATARESVGQLLPNATPQSSAWRSHLARRPLTLGAASLKARCYDAAMQRLLSPRPGATLLLRTSWQAAAESWSSHHSSNDNDVMAQTGGAEEDAMPCSGKCRARGPIARLQAADQQGQHHHQWSAIAEGGGPGQQYAV